MALIVSEPPVRQFIKVSLIEVEEYEPCRWRPTGRRMYVDRDAPLDCLKGWDKAQKTGECSVSKTIFGSILKIVEDALKKGQGEDES